MLVASDGSEKPLSKEEDSSIWKKFLTLSQRERDILTSYELPRILSELQSQYRLAANVIGGISYHIRRLFFKEDDHNSLLMNVTSLAGGDAELGAKIVSYIDNEIVQLKPAAIIDGVNEEQSGSSSAQISLPAKLPLLKALAEYPRLGEQSLTGEKIRIKGQGELQRPTLANWIRYYRDELGIGFHDQVTRGKFLFQSENGKKLGNEERERINLVLKSLEEEFPLDIDTNRLLIVFPVRTQPSPVSSAFPKAPSTLLETQPSQSFQPVTASPVAAAPMRVSAPAPRAVSPVKAFFQGTFGGGKQVANDTLHFSTGHVLSSEQHAPKAQERVMPSPAPVTPPNLPVASSASTRPMPPTLATSQAALVRPIGRSQSINMASISQNRGQALPRSPYSIRPLRLRDDPSVRETENR